MTFQQHAIIFLYEYTVGDDIFRIILTATGVM